MLCLYAVVCMYVFEHGRMDVQERGIGWLDLKDAHAPKHVSPHLELMVVADSEQQGRFNSVQFTSFSTREGFTD